MSAGYIYIAHFPNQDQLVKIGMTLDPTKRSRSLNSTSLPTALVMAKTWPVANPKIVERACHNHRLLKPFRNPGKEWFNVPLKTAIEICDQVCVGFSNEGFDVLYVDFKKLSVPEQKQFVIQFYRRWECAARLLTEFEKANPGFQDNNRSQLAKVAPAGVHPDAVQFWVEWHTLSKTVKQWQQSRKLDEYIGSVAPRHHGFDFDWRSRFTILLAQSLAAEDHYGTDNNLEEMDNLKEAIRDEITNKWQPIARTFVEYKCTETAIMEQMFAPRCSKGDLYNLRMDPSIFADQLQSDWLSAGGDRKIDRDIELENSTLWGMYDIEVWKPIQDMKTKGLQYRAGVRRQQEEENIKLARANIRLQKQRMEEDRLVNLQADIEWHTSWQNVYIWKPLGILGKQFEILGVLIPGAFISIWLIGISFFGLYLLFKR